VAEEVVGGADAREVPTEDHDVVHFEVMEGFVVEGDSMSAETIEGVFRVLGSVEWIEDGEMRNDLTTRMDKKREQSNREELVDI